MIVRYIGINCRLERLIKQVDNMLIKQWKKNIKNISSPYVDLLQFVVYIEAPWILFVVKLIILIAQPMSSPGQVNLIIVQPQLSTSQRFWISFNYGFKIACLVIGTYGLMVAMFALCLTIQSLGGSYYSQIPITYQRGGEILLGLFILEVVLWGIAWCWGAGRREGLRRSIVENQLAMIRAQEQAEEARDLQEERLLIEDRRRNKQ